MSERPNGLRAGKETVTGSAQTERVAMRTLQTSRHRHEWHEE
jgi:hypothetical protein